MAHGEGDTQIGVNVQTEVRRASRASVLLVHGRHVGAVGLRSMLLSEPGIRLLGDVPQEEQALEAAARLQPEIILFGSDGASHAAVGLRRGLRERAPAAKIIVVCDDAEQGVLRAVFAIPIDGYLAWLDLTPEVLRAVFVLTAASVRVASAASLEALVGASTTAAAVSSLELTELQRSILQGLDRGLSEAQIARSASVSPRTVRRAVNSLKRKLGVQTLYWVGRMVERLGLD